jgi:zinc transporter ZupT
MENWIGIGIWMVGGGLVGLAMTAVFRQPKTTPGHTVIAVILGSFAAVVGGMLGVGLFSFNDPVALSTGGMVGAVFLAVLFTFLYRWGTRSLI